MTDADLIRSLGGPKKVAVLLELNKPGSVQRVHNWIARGIPARVKLAYPALRVPQTEQANEADVAAPNSEPTHAS